MDNNNSNIISQINNMLNNTEIPDNIKELFNSSTNSSNSSSEKDDTSSNNNSDNNFDFSGIDIDTIMKMQQIMKNMNSEQGSARANLLRSLKPYLKPSRQDKVEQYIQLFSIGKVIEMFNSNNGGDNK